MLPLDTTTCCAIRLIHHDKLREYTLAWIQRRNNSAIGGYITIAYNLIYILYILYTVYYILYTIVKKDYVDVGN